MDEYPKIINVGGTTVTVTSAADEAKWRLVPDHGNPRSFHHEAVPEPETSKKKAETPIDELVEEPHDAPKKKLGTHKK